jgi:peroxiredoxin
MIQAEVGGAARIDPGTGLQRPGHMIRDFELPSSTGGRVRVSSFRGRKNLLLVFPGRSDAMRAFLEDAAKRSSEFATQEAVIITVLLEARSEGDASGANHSSTSHAITNLDPRVVVLHDDSPSAYRLSGALDKHGESIPLLYLTDRFGEIALAYSAESHTAPPSVDEILRTLDFLNQQCPECEPPEWPMAS